jgi:hypothetical protein
MFDNVPPWVSLVLTVCGAAVTIGVVWGRTTKTLEYVEKHGTLVQELYKAFTDFREEVRIKLAVNDVLLPSRQAVRGPAPVQTPAPKPPGATRRKPRGQARTYRVPTGRGSGRR